MQKKVYLKYKLFYLRGYASKKFLQGRMRYLLLWPTIGADIEFRVRQVTCTCKLLKSFCRTRQKTIEAFIIE